MWSLPSECTRMAVKELNGVYYLFEVEKATARLVVDRDFGVSVYGFFFCLGS